MTSGFRETKSPCHFGDPRVYSRIVFGHLIVQNNMDLEMVEVGC